MNLFGCKKFGLDGFLDSAVIELFIHKKRGTFLSLFKDPLNGVYIRFAILNAR
jgi:hypothetical protein